MDGMRDDSTYQGDGRVLALTEDEVAIIARMLRVGGPNTLRVANDIRCHPIAPDAAGSLRVLAQETSAMAERLDRWLADPEG